MGEHSSLSSLPPSSIIVFLEAMFHRFEENQGDCIIYITAYTEMNSSREQAVKVVCRLEYDLFLIDDSSEICSTIPTPKKITDQFFNCWCRSIVEELISFNVLHAHD